MADKPNKPKPIDDAVREQYDKEFDSKFYLNTFYGESHPSEEAALRKLQDVFSKGILKGPIKRCIDIGCGPIVHRLSAPSKVCETLVYSDFSSNNLKLVQDWLKGTISDPGVVNMFKLCAQVEGFDDLEKGAIEIQNRIKSKSPAVKHINILVSQPLGQLDQPFDVAFSGACFEGACDSYESYAAAVKNVATLIRDDGYLILKGYLEGTFYRVNDVEFPCLNLTVDMVKKAMKEGGFKVLEIDVIDEDVEEQVVGDVEYSNCTGSFFALVQKS